MLVGLPFLLICQIGPWGINLASFLHYPVIFHILTNLLKILFDQF